MTKTVDDVRLVGKRIVISLEGGLHLVVHLMIAGRLHWKPAGAALSRRQDLAAFDFPDATLTLTEAGSKRRASLHLVSGPARPGGAGPRRPRCPPRDARCISRNPALREPHAQARADRPASLQRDRQLVLGRDPACLAPFTASADPSSSRRGGGAPARVDRRGAEDVDRQASRANGRCLSGEGDSLPPRDGGSRAIRQALPRLRRSRSAHRLRGERGELLRSMSDGRAAPGRPGAFPAARVGLAAPARGCRRLRSPAADASPNLTDETRKTSRPSGPREAVLAASS